MVIAHDYLTQRGGAERVVLALLEAFPDAPIVTSIFNPEGTFPEFAGREIRVSPLQNRDRFRRNPRPAVALLPRIWRRTVIDDADVVIASSTGFAHGVTTKAPKLVYCHNPPRWLYQTEEYLLGHGKPTRMALKTLQPYLRRQDQTFAGSATRYLANSNTVADRIRTAYGREATVVAPAAGVTPYGPLTPIRGVEPGFLLNIARPRGYKNAVLAERAVMSLPGEHLVSVGNIRHDADANRQVTGLLNLDDSQIRWLYANCSGLIAASHEDFGLTVVEAAAFGKPSVALRAGGYLDTVKPGVTGVFFDEITTEGIRDGILALRQQAFSPEKIRQHAAHYTVARFGEDIRRHVDELLSGDQLADVDMAAEPASA